MQNAINLSTCSLQAFAAAVLTAAASAGTAPTERFGARKVFIAAVAAKLGVPVTADFAIRLISASRANLLELARADLVAAMPASAVQSSEIHEGMVEYHFVVDAGARESWDVEQRIPVIRPAPLPRAQLSRAQVRQAIGFRAVRSA